jgi:hypothetical protein
MEELNRWELVNKSETADQLKEAILSFAKDGEIQGRSRSFDAEKMASYVDGVIEGQLPPRSLTRNYGIRQQALYIMYYTMAEKRLKEIYDGQL